MEIIMKKSVEPLLSVKLAFALLISCLPIFLPSANAADCPTSWDVKIPELAITKVSAKYFGLTSEYYESNFAGVDRSSSETMGLILPRTPQNQAGRAYSLSKISPSLFEKLMLLGPNAVWSSYYQVVPSKSQPFRLSQYGEDINFSYPVRPWQFFFQGIGEDSEIVWKLKISVKGCADYNISSNSTKLPSLQLAAITLDEYFSILSNLPKPEFNFKQEDFIKGAIASNLEELKKLTQDQPLYLKRTGWKELDGKEFSYLLVGMKPAGCLDSVNPNSIPPVNPIVATLNSNDCLGGLLAGIPLADYENSEICGSKGWAAISKCEISEGYRALVTRMQGISGDWRYDKVLINTFQIRVPIMGTPTPIPTSKPSPTPTPLSTASASASSTSSGKRTTITCVKGKLIKKVTAVKPACPAGYKKK
jgi:hypothetical protein